MQSPWCSDSHVVSVQKVAPGMLLGLSLMGGRQSLSLCVFSLMRLISLDELKVLSGSHV